jgi:hypothetical protein
MEKRDHKEPIGRGQYGSYPNTGLRSTTRCYNCSTLGHYATDCLEPRKPPPLTPRSRLLAPVCPLSCHRCGAHQIGDPRPLSVRRHQAGPQHGKPIHHVQFAGEPSESEYWRASACVVLTTMDNPGIRFDTRYLKEIVPVLPPSPDLLLSGDVERNSGPLSCFPMQQGVLEYSMDELKNIHQWQVEKILERLNEANRYQSYGHYPLVLHRGDHERDKFQETYLNSSSHPTSGSP